MSRTSPHNHIASGEIMRIVDARAAKAGTPRRQTLLLSATLGPELQSLADLSLQDPTLVGLQQQADVGACNTGPSVVKPP